MTDYLDLLPDNASAFERAFSLASDQTGRLAAGIEGIPVAKIAPLAADFFPFMVYEFGLGEVTSLVPDPTILTGVGVDWQRIRGTPAALAMALGWIGYTASLDEAKVTRRRWHLFHLGLDRVRDAEAPDLDRIAGLAGLSVPVRSQFWRGFSGYDIRPHEYSGRRLSGALYATSSGARLKTDGPLWSFGRNYDLTAPLSQSVLQSLNAWVPLTYQASIGYGTIQTGIDSSVAGWTGIAWSDATWDWLDTDASARGRIIANALIRRPIWALFRDGGGAVIGARRARVKAGVAPDPTGPYSVAGVALSPDLPPTSLYLEFLTGFGDGAGQTAATVSLLFDAAPVDATKPGLPWAGPADLTAGTEVLTTPVSIAFGRTVRERLRFNLSF